MRRGGSCSNCHLIMTWYKYVIVNFLNLFDLSCATTFLYSWPHSCHRLSILLDEHGPCWSIRAIDPINGAALLNQAPVRLNNPSTCFKTPTTPPSLLPKC